jgi:hypothetical protein
MNTKLQTMRCYSNRQLESKRLTAVNALSLLFKVVLRIRLFHSLSVKKGQVLGLFILKFGFLVGNP